MAPSSAFAAPAKRVGQHEFCCCMTDGSDFYRDAPETIAQRFALYKSIGVDMLRVEFDWRDLEGTRENFLDDSASKAYFNAVRRTDFALKFIAGTMMAPPAWFLDANRDARMINQDGVFSTNVISYWYPKLHAVLEAKTRQQFQHLKKMGFQKRIRYVVADCGPAGEAIYPAMWTLGDAVTQETFWCYDQHAQADFRYRMRTKYTTIHAANRAWKTDFANWSAVFVPKPETQPGQFWRDVLTWYRDTKRGFILWQIENLQRHARQYLNPNVQLLMYVPGSDIRPAEWEDAVRSGAGSVSVHLMTDSSWLIQTAAQMGCVLQYTGAENRPEVKHLRAVLNASGLKNVAFWAENAGVVEAARDPLTLADIVIKNDLIGLDFTHSHFAFAANHITPNAIFKELAQAFALIHRHNATNLPKRA